MLNAAQLRSESCCQNAAVGKADFITGLLHFQLEVKNPMSYSPSQSNAWEEMGKGVEDISSHFLIKNGFRTANPLIQSLEMR